MPGGGSKTKVPPAWGVGINIFLKLHITENSLRILQSLLLLKYWVVKRSLKKVMKSAVKHLCTNNVYNITKVNRAL